MNRLILILIILAAGWYGNSLYKQNELPFISSLTDNFKSEAVLKKCVTKQGEVFYGKVPNGIVCTKVKLSSSSYLTEVPSKTINKLQRKSSRFKCDGREYCSQMTSRVEAEFFVRNCPNVKMDGDRDGIPCENDSRF